MVEFFVIIEGMWFLNGKWEVIVDRLEFIVFFKVIIKGKERYK